VLAWLAWLAWPWGPPAPAQRVRRIAPVAILAWRFDAGDWAWAQARAQAWQRLGYPVRLCPVGLDQIPAPWGRLAEGRLARCLRGTGRREVVGALAQQPFPSPPSSWVTLPPWAWAHKAQLPLAASGYVVGAAVKAAYGMERAPLRIQLELAGWDTPQGQAVLAGLAAAFGEGAALRLDPWPWGLPFVRLSIHPSSLDRWAQAQGPTSLGGTVRLVCGFGEADLRRWTQTPSVPPLPSCRVEGPDLGAVATLSASVGRAWSQAVQSIREGYQPPPLPDYQRAPLAYPPAWGHPSPEEGAPRSRSIWARCSRPL
jgi:hypothetical protein